MPFQKSLQFGPNVLFELYYTFIIIFIATTINTITIVNNDRKHLSLSTEYNVLW